MTTYINKLEVPKTDSVSPDELDQLFDYLDEVQQSEASSEMSSSSWMDNSYEVVSPPAGVDSSPESNMEPQLMAPLVAPVEYPYLDNGYESFQWEPVSEFSSAVVKPAPKYSDSVSDFQSNYEPSIPSVVLDSLKVSPVYEDLDRSYNSSYLPNSTISDFASCNLDTTPTNSSYNISIPQDYYFPTTNYTTSQQYLGQYQEVPTTIPTTIPTEFTPSYSINVLDPIPTEQYSMEPVRTTVDLPTNTTNVQQSIITQQPTISPSNDSPPIASNIVTSASTRNSKPKRHRTCYSSEQIRFLQERFAENPYLQRSLRMRYAEQLLLCERQIKIWYQNQRMKQKNKLKNSESADGSPVVAPRRPGRPKKEESEKSNEKTEAQSHRENVGRLMSLMPLPEVPSSNPEWIHAESYFSPITVDTNILQM